MSTKSALLIGVLVGVAVLGVAFVGPQIFYNASAQPTDNVYMPLILREILQAVSTASGPLQVFPSSGTTDGDIAGGRVERAAMCTATDTDSHPVTLAEIENAWISTGVIFSSISGQTWVDSGALGTIGEVYDGSPASNWASSARTCIGYTSNLSNWDGLTLNAGARNVETSQSCDQILPIACGKH